MFLAQRAQLVYVDLPHKSILPRLSFIMSARSTRSAPHQVERGASLLEDMIGGLQEAAEKTLGGILPRSRALAAREVARQQPGTSF